MVKVAFFVNNNRLLNVDCRSITSYNPGLPGTEYEFLLVSYLLEQRNKGFEVFLFVNFDGVFPHKNVTKVSSLEQCCDYCRKQEIQTLIVRNQERIECCSKFPDLDIVLWAHNDIHYKHLDAYVQNPNIKKIVNCGREQLELYRDHIATIKSTYVYNIFPIKEKEHYLARIHDRDNHNVVYMGSFVPDKGFHILARSWKKVLRVVPDAELFVIGSAKLYDRNCRLGKYGIAESEYENLFMPNLTDDNGKILESVHFLGILGDEKYDVLGRCKVAVPNPTGLSECLPLTVIEMQLMGCNITTIRHQAYLDTLANKDYLYSRVSHLSDYIIRRLIAPPDEYGPMYDFVAKKFGIGSNMERWERLLTHLSEPNDEDISNNNYHCKKLKNLLLNVKLKFNFLNCIPVLERFYNFRDTHLKIGGFGE